MGWYTECVKQEHGSAVPYKFYVGNDDKQLRIEVEPSELNREKSPEEIYYLKANA